MSKKNSAKDAELYIKNKRYNTSKTLATNDMWSKTIGHDPHANIVHDLDISVQALHGGGESEEFKNLSRLVAKSRGTNITGGGGEIGRSWRGKKPLKGTFSVPACYNNIESLLSNSIEEDGEEEEDHDYNTDGSTPDSSSSASSSSSSDDEAAKKKKMEKKIRKKMKKQKKKEKKKLKKQKKKEKKKLKKEKKKLKQMRKKRERENVTEDEDNRDSKIAKK